MCTVDQRLSVNHTVYIGNMRLVYCYSACRLLDYPVTVTIQVIVMELRMRCSAPERCHEECPLLAHH